MTIEKDKDLKAYNTFGISAKAKYFVAVEDLTALSNALQNTIHPRKFIISGGSNMLITQDIDALVIHLNIKGKEIVWQDENSVHIKINAGENWHQLVLWTLSKDYGGLENMSLIPGNAGTAPIQNIGAYGIELKDNFYSCQAMEISTQKLVDFSKTDCNFGYRDSFFKNEGKGKYIITSITLALSKKNHTLNTSYGAIEAQLNEMGITKPTIQTISDAVIAIRQQKLPDPKILGNSGSFFKNPIISKTNFEDFSTEYPNAPFYKLSETEYKIPAGWLIEQCGFKGKRFGDAGVHKNQALVLVNYENATGNEILELSKNVINAVKIKFKITIEPEVNIIS